MDRSETAYLVTTSWIQDKYGVNREVSTERKIFVQVDSVSGAEWFEGGRNGLNPELRFTTLKHNYSGEEILKFGDQYYTIYRTYLGRGNTVELYCEKRKGNADRQDQLG